MSKSCILTITQGDFNYIKEWIEYHHNIGVDLFLIGYNGNSEDFYKLPKYDYVKYIDFSFNTNDVNSVFKVNNFSGYYKDHVSKYKHFHLHIKLINVLLEYVKLVYKNIDYTIFIDTDEFISIKDKNSPQNINDFLNMYFPNINSSIQIEMEYYTDNNLIYYDNKPCVERFTEICHPLTDRNWREWDSKIILNNNHGDFYDLHYTSPHYCTKYINWFTLPADKIVLKHFFTKSLEEWISKFNPENDRNYTHRFGGKMLETFFLFDGIETNKMTEEKMKAIPQLLKKYNINYDPSTDETNYTIREFYKKCNNL